MAELVDFPDFHVRDQREDSNEAESLLTSEESPVGRDPVVWTPLQRFAGLGFDPTIVAQVYEARGRDQNRTQQCLLAGEFR
jgi:hypothetical protein